MRIVLQCGKHLFTHECTRDSNPFIQFIETVFTCNTYYRGNCLTVLQCSSSRNDLVSTELLIVLTEVILSPFTSHPQDSDGPSRQDSVQPPVFPALRKSRVVSSTSEEEEALTEKFLKINCKYITDGKVRWHHCHCWWAHRDTVAPFWSCNSIISYVWQLFIPCLWYLSLFSRIHA